MDVFNKLRSTVSSTVSQLSGVLPGNPVTREFEATHHVASAGPGLMWKVYEGYKKSTKQEAAIFLFEKRHLDRWSRNDKETMLDILRRGVSQLTRLRHPQILIVQHPLEESRESLAFATEPVFASLSNVLGFTENMPVPPPHQLKDFNLFEVEIKYGLLQISEGLAFLHNDVKLLHRNLCPDSIIINQQGAWKIFGFDFCMANQNTQNQQPFWPFREYIPDLHHHAQPNLDYLAPEYALTLSHSPASDMFSLGMLIYSLFSKGKPLNQSSGEWKTYKRNACELKQLSTTSLNCVPEGMREYVKMMLNVTPELRPDAHQFTKISFFEDVGVKTLNYLDSLFQWDNLQKSQFYKGLPQIIPKLPHRVALYRILPCLVKEFVNPSMVPFVLPNVLLISENCSKEEFCQHVLNDLKPVMKIQDPIQILLIFMQKMELLLKLTPAESVKTDVLPMLYRALESDAQQIQELCLSVLPTFAGLVDYPAMKNALLPRIKRLCLNTSYISVRVNCLVCVGKLLEHLDKWLVLDEILPFLPQIPSREPAVLMGILGIYKLALTHKKLGITKELMATKVLPFLMPLSIENGLTLNQFNALIGVIKEMVQRVETEHRVKLEQLNSIQQEQKSALQMTLSAPANPKQLVAAPEVQSELDQMFSGLGLGNFIDKKPSSYTEPSVPSSQGTAMVNGSAKTGGSLSLEEKQRLAKEQEVQQRLKSQPSLVPSASLAPAPKPQVKDLTASLLESNLNQMKYNKPIDVPTGGQQFVGNSMFPNPVPSVSPSVPLSVPTMAQGSAVSPGFGAFQSSMPVQWQNPQMMASGQPARLGIMGSPQPVGMGPVGASQTMGMNLAPQNFSSLDSLLTSQPKVPMNQMPISQMPLHPMNTRTMTTPQFQQPTTKPLSSNEINDFLS